MRKILLMVGTTKGAFLFSSNTARKTWKMEGPFFKGRAINALAHDVRGRRNRIWASVQSMHWGSFLAHTDNLGKKWVEPETANVQFPKSAGLELSQIWQIEVSPHDADKMFCGVAPASLFESNDAGMTWSLNEGLYNHPHRPKWMPGGGGLCLHTILPDPKTTERLTIAISTGGVYRSDDGGKSWASKNVGVRAEFMPDKFPEFGQCVHKVIQHTSKPNQLMLQNHWGLYRSTDAGDSWKDIANGVPSDFGFAMASHPNDAKVAYIVPLTSDEFRCTPDAKLRVYRTEDAGGSWKPLSKGLPQKHAFETVLRDGLTTDSEKTAGVYFGTRSGKLFGSANEGEKWSAIIDGLPPILCVKTSTIQ